jgi:hypothetical protein
MTEPLPASVWDFLADKRIWVWACPVAGHTRVEWRGDIAHCAAEGCSKSSANFSWADADEDASVD